MMFKLERTARNIRIIRLCVLDGSYPPLGIFPWLSFRDVTFRESSLFIFAPMHTLYHKLLRNASGFSEKLSLNSNLVVIGYHQRYTALNLGKAYTSSTTHEHVTVDLSY